MKPVDPSEKELRQFGLMMAGVFSFFGAVLFYKTWTIAASVLVVLILFFGSMGFASPLSLILIHKKWMRLAEMIGNFNAKVILSLTYFILFTVIRMVASVFREDPLRRKIEPEKDSYWIDCAPREMDPKRYEKQF